VWSSGTHELGGTVVVMEKFDAEQFLALVEREAVTHTQVVPTMLVRLMKLAPEVRGRYDLSSLECVVHAAAPCPIEVKHQVIEWLGPIVHEYFAATEGNGMTFITATEWLEHPGSVGRPMFGIPHVCDEEGDEVPVGEAGLIYFEQEQTPFEYHGDPEKTRASRHREHDNWSALGDIGYVDHDGYIYLTDRKAFTIISGGVNIYPAEIEACLIMHPSVTDIAVFGLPDSEMGEYVHAVVQPADGLEGSPELAQELLRYAREHLARYKVPRVIDFRTELPRLPTGKLYKQGLRDEYRTTMA
jgi:acyl-coenzyme A synthetase/AMP-(fatty) acid ligase